MRILEYAFILRRRWPALILPALVIAAASLMTAPVTPPPTYAVTMRFAGGLPPERVSSSTYGFDGHYNWLASEYVTRALAQAVETGAFAANLSARLAAEKIVVPVGVVRSEYVASYLKVTVSWADGPQAEAIARAVVAELTENAAAYWPQLADASASPVRLLDPPAAVATPAPLRSRFDLPVRIALAVAAGLLAAFAWHALDPYVRDARQIDLPMLAEAPGRSTLKF